MKINIAGFVILSLLISAYTANAANNQQHEINLAPFIQVTDNKLANYKPSIVRTFAGEYVMVYDSFDPLNSSNWDLYVTISFDDGLTWSEPYQILSTPYMDAYPSLVQDQDWNFVLSFLSNRDGSYENYIAKSPCGTNWTEPVKLDLQHSEQEANANIMLEPDNSFTCVWQSLSGGIYISHSVDLVTWEAPVLIDSSGRLPAIMKHSEGTYLAAYQIAFGGTWVEIFCKSSADGYDWSAPAIQLTETMNSHDAFPVQLPNGDYLIAYSTYFTGQPYDIYYRTSTDALTWEPEVLWIDTNNYDIAVQMVRVETDSLGIAWGSSPSSDYSDCEIFFTTDQFEAPACTSINYFQIIIFLVLIISLVGIIVRIRGELFGKKKISELIS